MNDYRIIFYWSNTDHCFLTEVPSLPGCMSDGKTIEEAVANTQGIIADWIETAQESGRPVPPEDNSAELQSTNPSVTELALYILEQTGKITTMKLQKLVYYCQAWSLAWCDMPLCNTQFYDWKDGPVSRELFDSHHGKRIIDARFYQKESHTFSSSEQQLISAVLSVYGEKDAQWLSNLTHYEAPWKDTRNHLTADQPDDKCISQDAIKAYYGIVRNVYKREAP